MRRVLSIDGGGIRGLIPATLLLAMEGKGLPPFDLAAGTSTGGLMVCGIATGLSAQAIIDLYVQHGKDVFDENPIGGLLEAKYHPSKLEDQLKNILGTKRLSEISKPEILIPSYCVRLPEPTDTDGDGILEGAASLLFRSWKARTDPASDWPLWEICRATSAAPTYFPSAVIDGDYTCIDGGVFANNPAMCALAAAWSLWPGEQVKVLSLGTGSKVTAVDAGNWGAVQWAPNIASVMMDGSADTVTYQCQAFLGSNFLRCDIALAGANDAFDDCSAGNIAALQNLAAAITASHIDRVIAFLR